LKKIKKPYFFIIVAFIITFSVFTVTGFSTYYGDNHTTWIKGVEDIRWGIDIRGGVDVTFVPSADYAENVTNDDIDAARSIIETRLISKNITDYEIYPDYNSKRIILRFPWQSGEGSFDPEEAVKELGEMALLTFREGDARPGTNEYLDLPIIIQGSDIAKATPLYDPTKGYNEDDYYVALDLNQSGREAFSEATGRLVGTGEVISIWLDDYRVSAPVVSAHIVDGSAQISGKFLREEAKDLADKINGGALPFRLETDSMSIINPSLGESARDAMAIAGIIAFILMAIFMIIRYKLPGMAAVFGLAGQAFGALAVISGFFGFADSFTLTIPGIAGIILSIGMGIDANVITAERIKEELRAGKSLDGALQSGYKRAFSAIFDSNITLIIIAFILMGAFGTPDSFAAKILSPIFFMFGPSTAGPIYSFGFTLVIGAVLNFIFGVFASRVMIYSISRFKKLRNPALYGGYKNEEQKEKDKNKQIFDAVANKKRFFVPPVVVLVTAVAVMLVFGLQVAIEFKGGTIISYNYEGEINEARVKTAVEELGKGTVNVKLGSSIISETKTVTIEFTSDEGLTAEKQYELSQKLEETFPENNLVLEGSQDVNPTMGRTFFLKCLVAVIFSFAVLVLYIALRFKKISGWSAGMFAIVALLNNVMIVFAAFIFFRFAIDANFMAVVLTILGYSINDTIVIYDRIRENRGLFGKRVGSRELVNRSISQSFTRSLNTSGTTALAMVVICIVAVIMGVNSIISFAFPLVIGIGSGFVSSLYIAGPLWVTWQEFKEKKKSA